ncbi:MAG: haloacid dehalogenase type II [Euryarchaeota archaeon]|nr:haloacid dehalogenase type II [Euryarchaeota archaeon]
MSFDSHRVETITFDSYSTLVDVDAAERALEARVEDPEPVSKLWRARSLEYTFVSNGIDAYQPFYEMNRDALQHALDAHGVDLPSEERDEILAVYHELDVFCDVRDGIERLRDGGYDTYVVSNGNPEMLDSMVEHADIGDLLSDTISADEVQIFKPAAELYRHAAARTGTPIDEIAHVTAGWFDVMGAKHAGMQAVWADRKGAPWEPFGSEPDLRIESFDELAKELGV